MPKMYVLDVPEFRCLLDEARKRARCRVTFAGHGYYCIESDGELVFHRRELKVKPAVWYGLFTGGLRGRITDFDRETVRIADAA